jgi:hypothetical protein
MYEQEYISQVTDELEIILEGNGRGITEVLS